MQSKVGLSSESSVNVRHKVWQVEKFGVARLVSLLDQVAILNKEIVDFSTICSESWCLFATKALVLFKAEVSVLTVASLMGALRIN